MNQDNLDQLTGNSDEASLKNVKIKFKNTLNYLKKKWLIILAFSVVGAAVGVVIALIKKPIYTAVCTFVLEDGSKSGGLGQYAGLASIAGIDVGAGGGMFQGDNILELYKSRLMIEKALLSKTITDGKQELLIERYIQFNKLRQKWNENDKIENINFNGDPLKFSRVQDSLVTDIVELINLHNLSVTKPDKKLSIIKVAFISEDEFFAKEFVIKLVGNVNEFYVQTKTKKSQLNVDVLQHQKDSVRRILDFAIVGVASAMDASPNANPAMLILRAPSQKRQVDVQASTAVYGEIVKNLEISKVALMQEKPLIQIIDSPILPLAKDKLSKRKGILIGFIMAGIFIVFVLVIKKIFTES